MVRASALRGYPALLQSLGADPAPLLRRFHIPAASLGDDEALMSLRACAQLLEASAARTGRGDFGLRLAQVQDIGVLGPLGIVMQNAATVREAWELGARYVFVHSPGLVVQLHDDSRLVAGAVDASVQVRLPKLPAQRQVIDLCLGHVHQNTRLLAGSRYQLRAVALPHRPLVSLAVYKRFFAAPVYTEQPMAALCLSRETLRADLSSANPALRQITEDYLERHFRAPGENITTRVRQALRRSLGTPHGSKEGIAGLLAMHPRTLQRHLAAEHSSFEVLRDEMRKEAALRYLRETQMPLGQLADLLGLSEQSALSRSCRRWFGAPPSLLRRP